VTSNARMLTPWVGSSCVTGPGLIALEHSADLERIPSELPDYKTNVSRALELQVSSAWYWYGAALIPRLEDDRSGLCCFGRRLWRTRRLAIQDAVVSFGSIHGRLVSAQGLLCRSHGHSVCHDQRRREARDAWCVSVPGEAAGRSKARRVDIAHFLTRLRFNVSLTRKKGGIA
jgi:hypothetical protein